ncbi:MAG: nucleotidyltransferase domain-containing protein [bacterium]
MSYNQFDTLGLSKSKARKALLAIFFTNPEQEYFTRQLERLSGIYAANLQRELLKMEDGGLLESRHLGKLKLYKLNMRHPLYSELKSLVAKTIGLEEIIRSGISAVKGVTAACIYGSFARGEERSNSDIDVLIIGNNIDEDNLIRVLKSLEEKLQREINYSLYSSEDWRKRKKAKDSFIVEVMKQPKIMIHGSADAFK